jgi:hypothetical protein
MFAVNPHIHCGRLKLNVEQVGILGRRVFRSTRRRALALQAGEPDRRDGCRPRQKGRRTIKPKSVPDNFAFVTPAQDPCGIARTPLQFVGTPYCNARQYTPSQKLRMAEKRACEETEGILRPRRCSKNHNLRSLLSDDAGGFFRVRWRQAIAPNAQRSDIALIPADLRHTECPSGKSPKTCPAPLRKIFRFPRRANQRYQLAPSFPGKRGVSRSSRTREGMWWTRQRRRASVRRAVFRE